MAALVQRRKTLLAQATKDVASHKKPAKGFVPNADIGSDSDLHESSGVQSDDSGQFRETMKSTRTIERSPHPTQQLQAGEQGAADQNKPTRPPLSMALNKIGEDVEPESHD